MALLDVFDEFPRPLERDDLNLLRTEVLRLHKAHKTLSGALHYYSKAADIAKKTISVIDAKHARELNPTSTGFSASASNTDIPTSHAPNNKRPRDDESEGQHGTSLPSSSPPTATTAAALDAGQPTTTSNAPTSSSPASVPPVVQAAPAPASGRRRFVQSAALLAGMKKMIAANQRQEANDGTATLREERERIAKEAREKAHADEVALANAQLARAEAAVCDLQSKIQTIRPRLATLGHMLDTADIMEADYCASFYLRAYANTAMQAPADDGNDEATAVCEGAASPVDDEQERQKQVDEDETGLFDDEIYFAPPAHTETTLEMVRLQIYDEILDDYLHYRAQLDPLLAEIRAMAAERRPGGSSAKRVQASGGATAEGTQHSGGIGGGAAAAPATFSPMSAEEASMLVLRATTANGGAAGEVDATRSLTAKEGTDDAAAAVSWSLYEDAIAALDEFE